MVCVSRTYHLEVKYKEICENLHNVLNHKITVARVDLKICQLILSLYPSKNKDNSYVFTFMGAR